MKKIYNLLISNILFLPFLAHGQEQSVLVEPVTSNIYIDFGRATKIITLLLGVAAVFYLLMGVGQLVTASGDRERFVKGRGKIIDAIILSLIAVGTYFLPGFVANRL